MVYKKQNYIGFAQITELMIDRILIGEYTAGNRIPSVREMAEIIEVTPSTIVRAYNRLEALELIYTKVGIGFFISDDALEKCQTLRLKELKEEVLPQVIQKCNVLGLSKDEVLTMISQIDTQEVNNKP